MKRMLMLMFGAFFVSVSVYGKEISGKKYENILWTFDDEFGNLRIEGIASSPGYIAMPDVPDITKTGEIGFFSYKSVSEAWHPYRHSITNVYISQGVTKIGSYAFWGHKNMKRIDIPNSVYYIDNHAFAGCSNLTSVSLSYWFRQLDSTAFVDCPKLERISVNETNHWFQSIDGVLYGPKEGTISYKYQKKDVLLRCPPARYADGRVYDIPDNAIEIGDYSFMGCSGIGGVNIPDTVRHIGEQAFDGCTGFVHVELPSSVTSVDSYAFKDCANLKSVVLPPSLGSLSSSVFEGCSSLETIFMHADTQFDAASLPASVSIIRWKIIDDRILVISGRGSVPYWRKCPWSSEIDSIKSVTIGNGITNISEDAFYECRGLTSVTIPDSVTSIGEMAFYKCSGLTSVTIGNSVTSIGDEAFSWCSDLTSVTIGNSVTSIGEYAFSECWGLTSVTIPDSVTSIGDSAFSWCSDLTSVTIGDSVTSIGDSAFSGCSGLTSVMIGNSLTSIGRWAFEYCDNLKSAIFLGDAPKYVGYDIFCDCADDFTIKVKKGTKGWNGDYTSTALPATWHGYPIEYARGDDLYPELDANATAEDVANALSGSVDENLAKNITSVEMYNNYREWALSVKNTSGDEVAGVEAVKASSNAWLSFALDSDVLIANKPVDGDVVIDSFEKDSASGLFEFTVNIKDIGVGGDAIEENLRKVFGIEGAETLASGGTGFSLDNVEVNAVAPVNGNVKFTVTPKGGALGSTRPASFFFRVKMK